LLQPPQVHASSVLLFLIQELRNEHYGFGVASNDITFIPRPMRTGELNERKEEAHRLLHNVSPVHMNNVQLPSADHVKYLGLHLDRKLTWHHHIFTKRKQLGLTLTEMYWLLGRSSRLSLPNRLLLYKTILNPIWTYRIQLWGTASTSNIEILERFQSRPCA
jgi:hypothetical protein